MNKQRRVTSLTREEEQVTLAIRDKINQGISVAEASSFYGISRQTYYKNSNYLDLQQIKNKIRETESLKDIAFINIGNISGKNKDELLSNIAQLIPDDAQDITLRNNLNFMSLGWAGPQQNISEERLEEIAWSFLREQKKKEQFEKAAKKKAEKEYTQYLDLKKKYESDPEILARKFVPFTIKFPKE